MAAALCVGSGLSARNVCINTQEKDEVVYLCELMGHAQFTGLWGPK